MEALHLVSLAPATVGACCSLGVRRPGRALAGASAGAMLVAMLDAALGSPLLPPVLWSVLLLALAVATAGRARRVPGGSRWMQAHSALGLVATAALLAAMGSSAGAVEHSGHGGSMTVALVAAAVGAAHLAASVPLLRMPRQPAIVRVETAAMAASVAAMTLALLG